MKPFKITAVLILFLLLMQGILFPRISSRVEGTVVDEETGNPIAGASVGLFSCLKSGIAIRYMAGINHKTNTFYIETDSKGYFVFDDLHETEYFLVVFKEGYASVGPFFYKKPGPFEDANGLVFTTKIDSFVLEEGQIKHFKIKMEKEAILKVSVFMKTFSCIEPIDEFHASIFHPGFSEKFEELIKPGIINNAFTERAKKLVPVKYIKTENGFQTIYFKKGSVTLTIYANGFPPKTFANIQLEKGQTRDIDYIVDFTKPPVIYGTIKNKDTGEPFHVVYLTIKKQDEPNKYHYLKTYSDKDGKYWYGGIEPGKYIFHMYSFGGDKDFDFKMVIEVNPNSILEINKQF